MKASAVNLRYKTKMKRTIVPATKPAMKTREHPFFGSSKGDKKSVKQVMKGLRGGRYRDI